MATSDDITKADPTEIDALIQRLKQSNLEPRDAQLVERLLRLVLSMASLLQHNNASIKRLRRLIFGPSSYKRPITGSSTEEEATPGEDSSPVTTKMTTTCHTIQLSTEVALLITHGGGLHTPDH
jgi:hypothetical protein